MAGMSDSNSTSDRDNTLVEIVGSNSPYDTADVIDDGVTKRLAVTTGVTSNSYIIYRHEYLKNGSAIDMNVNGSSTPVEYIFAPLAGEVWFVESVGMYLEDGGVTSSNKIGATSETTNGMILKIKSLGTEYTIHDAIKTNLDITMLFADTSILSSASAGWLDSYDLYYGRVKFYHPIKLIYGDFVKAIVRDNYSSIDSIRSNVHIWKVI